jgi:hypothetical protein
MAERWKRLAPLSGIVFVGLVVASIVISGNQPDVNDGPSKVAAYYETHHGRTIAQVALLAYAALFAVVYFVSVSHFLRSRGSQLMATLTVVGGALFAVGCGLGAGGLAGLSEATNHFTADQLQLMNTVANDMFWPMMMVGTTVATLAIGVSTLQTRALPKALGIITVIVGVVLLSGIGTWFGFMATGPLTIVIACYVAVRLGRPTSISLPEMPGQRMNADVSTSETTPAT